MFIDDVIDLMRNSKNPTGEQVSYMFYCRRFNRVKSYDPIQARAGILSTFDDEIQFCMSMADVSINVTIEPIDKVRERLSLLTAASKLDGLNYDLSYIIEDEIDEARRYIDGGLCDEQRVEEQQALSDRTRERWLKNADAFRAELAAELEKFDARVAAMGEVDYTPQFTD